MIKDFFINKKTEDELRFVEYLGVKDGKDIHLLKMKIKQPDGSFKPEVRYIEDFKMPFWITKKIFRDHNDTKEYESLKRVDMFKSTQSNIYREAAKRLGMRAPEYKTRRQVTPSQYVYGLDITASSYIKEWYIKNGPNTDWEIAAYDLEVDIENFDNQFITHASMATKDESYLYILRSRFHPSEFKTEEDIFNKIKLEYMENAEEEWDSKKRYIKLYDNSVDILEASIADLHIIKPDLVGIWNSAYDINKIIEEYETRSCRSLAELFIDPTLPKHLAHFKFIEGRNKIITITDSGKEKIKTFKPHQIHHDLITAASFKIVDAMGLFYQLRSQGPDEEGGYSLDNVANNYIGSSKLHQEQPLNTRHAHVHTSKYFPAFYSAYSMNDSDIMVRLDNKTKDMYSTAPTQLGAGLWSKFNSLPYRLHVNFEFHILEQGYVVGTRSANMDTDPILGIGEGWIVTVPSYKMKLPYNSDILEDGYDDMYTTHFHHSFDMDEVAAYPRATVACNVSQQTTKAEVIKIDGKKKDDFLQVNLGVVANKVNSHEFCTHHFNHPTYEALTDEQIVKYLK